MSYTLIERKELSSNASIISFDNIPQNFTDLYVLVSARTDRNALGAGLYLTVNGSTANISGRYLEGNGSSAASGTEPRLAGTLSGATSTANIFSNNALYFPNYTSNTNKSFSVDGLMENNATTAYSIIISGLWSQTAAITSLGFSSSVNDLVAGSSISLYGINRQQAIGTPKAIGGAITFANGYWYHTFNSSGTFSAFENLQINSLVVAGGGSGGGSNRGGGGGAGGLLSSSSTVNQGNYSVIVGAGGSNVGIGENVVGTDGNNSSFLTSLSIGGGGGGRGANSISTSGSAGRAGGSGGGGGITGQSGLYAFAGGAGTSGQGNNGGSSGHDHTTYGKGGGGGGAGAVGTSITANGQRGNGGIGIQWLNGTYYAGGGGGAGDGSNPGGLGGLGGGGDSGLLSPYNGVSGTSNTGGGGGGANSTPGIPGSGGSGVVIIRYPA